MRATNRRPDTVVTGRVGASMSAYGLLDPQMRDAWERFQRLNTEEARAAYADQWLRLCGRRLEQAWPMLYELLAIMKEGRLYEQPAYVEGGRPYPSFEAYFEATVKLPFSRWAELEGTYRFVQEYAPELWEAGYSKARVEALKRLDEFDKATKRQGGRPGETVDNINSFSRPGGTSRQYALRRLRRSRPDLHERLLHGELTPHAAMLEAGFRRRTLSVEPSPKALDRFLRRHLSADQIEELVGLLMEKR